MVETLKFEDCLKRDFFEHFVIRCVTTLDRKDPITGQRTNPIYADRKNSFTVEFKIDGHEIPLRVVVDIFEAMMDRMIAEAAVDLVENKFRNITDAVTRAEDAMKLTLENMSRDLGLPRDD